MNRFIALLLIPGTIAAQSSGRVSVGKNVQVSSAMPGISHYEVLIDADPENPSRLIACSMFAPESGLFGHRTVVYTSADGGKSWSRSLVDSIAVGLRSDSYDPACIFGLNGAMHFARLKDLGVYTSTDGGRTWSLTELPASPEAKNTVDRDWMAIDRTGGKYHGRIYVYAQAAGPLLDGGYTRSAIMLWRSLDGGKTFEPPAQRHPPAEGSSGVGFHPGNSVVLSDGTWMGAINHLNTLAGVPGYGDPRNPRSAHIKVLTSTDGGETMEPAVVVGNPYNAMQGGGSTMPMIATDTQSPLFKDRVYVAWADKVGTRFHLVMAYSTDRGKTWSSPRVVSDELVSSGENDLNRHIGRFSIAVNKSGVVGLMWEDRRNNAANDHGHEIRFAASLDGGDTFTPTVLVSEKAHVLAGNERWITSASDRPWESKVAFDINRHTDGGHTVGITVDPNGTFHPIWVDNRTGVDQLWTAPVTVNGTPAKFGNANLAALSDLSTKVKIEILGSTYDHATRRVTVRARLKNQSSDTIAGPIKVRALLMSSDATTTGTALAVDSENGIKGTGAQWDFTSLLSGASLLPNGTTGERVLVFELPSLRPMGPGKKFMHGMAVPRSLLHFEGQVLGATRKSAGAVHP